MRFLLGMGAFFLIGGPAFALTGTVKDNLGVAIAGAEVSLASDTSVHVNTNASGAFTINPPVSVFDRGFSGAQAQKTGGADRLGSQITFSFATRAQAGTADLFAADGSRMDNNSRVSKTTQNRAPAVLARRSAAAAAIDTLVTKKAGYTTVKTPIDAFSQTDLVIVLNAGSTLPPVTNYSAMGPYEVITETGKGPDGSYTVIRPKTLGANGFLHAPITFGPGTDMQVSQLKNLIERIASHGFVVIGRQLTGGPGDAVTRQRLIAGLEWIIAQNSVAGSVYQGKIAVTKGVAMGYSVGATGSIEIGGHAALATVVAIHGHSAKGETKVPMLMIGGTADLNGGVSWLAPSYAASTTQTFFSLLTGANHGYIQGTVNGVQGGSETPAIIAWIRYWIYNDQGAKNYFYGDDCVMCKSPWANTQRKNWK
jgi:hypothetical protein